MARDIQKYFPKHDIYIEPFFGAGGMFFNKPKVKYNLLNDIDKDVYNLYRQLLDNKEELIKQIEIVPIDEGLFKEWGNGKRENSDLLNAIRFLVLSNFGLYGKPNTIRIGANNPRGMILKNIEKTFEYLKDCYFFNIDFRKIFTKLDINSELTRCFCYCDPPYLGTDDNYSDSFTEADSFDLFELMQSKNIKWAMSEFDNPFILKQAKERSLFVNIIGERKNLNNRRVEVLITNYKTPQLSLF